VYHTPADIKEIGDLMQDIQSGKVSRNKNYYTLAETGAYQRFKRAKLLISLVNDINNTAAVAENRIDVLDHADGVEINLFNPLMKYNRKILITRAEFHLIRDYLNFKGLGEID